MYNSIKKQLFSMLSFAIYPCVIHGLGKLLCKSVYSQMQLFFFASALLWLCKSRSKQMLIKNSHLFWRTRWVKYFKTIPNFGIYAVVKQAVQNLNILLCGWLHWTYTNCWSSRQSAVSAISSEEATVQFMAASSSLSCTLYGWADVFLCGWCL